MANHGPKHLVILVLVRARRLATWNKKWGISPQSDHIFVCFILFASFWSELKFIAGLRRGLVLQKHTPAPETTTSTTQGAAGSPKLDARGSLISSLAPSSEVVVEPSPTEQIGCRWCWCVMLFISTSQPVRMLLRNSPGKMAEQIMLDKASRKNRAACCRKVKTANWSLQHQKAKQIQKRDGTDGLLIPASGATLALLWPASSARRSAQGVAHPPPLQRCQEGSPASSADVRHLLRTALALAAATLMQWVVRMAGGEVKLGTSDKTLAALVGCQASMHWAAAKAPSPRFGHQTSEWFKRAWEWCAMISSYLVWFLYVSFAWLACIPLLCQAQSEND